MRHPKLVLGAQLVAAVIILAAGAMKFMGMQQAVDVFRELNMEPTGRYLVGFIEVFAGLALLSPFAAFGALLTFSVTCGAVIAHASHLGLTVHHDGGQMTAMLALTLISSGIVLIARRRELPIIGSSL